MARGNDGSGWSMSTWPRRSSKIGQDRPDTSPRKPKKKAHGGGVKRDPKKFEAALGAFIGPAAAARYVRRFSRKKKVEGPL